MRRSITGLRAWLVQRLTAVYMLVFIVFFLAHSMMYPAHSHAAWHAWMTSTAVSIASLVFFAALLAHAWVGVRDVILDYVHPVPLRVALLALLALGLAATVVWVAKILMVTPPA